MKKHSSSESSGNKKAGKTESSRYPDNFNQMFSRFAKLSQWYHHFTYSPHTVLLEIFAIVDRYAAFAFRIVGVQASACHSTRCDLQIKVCQRTMRDTPRQTNPTGYPRSRARQAKLELPRAPRIPEIIFQRQVLLYAQARPEIQGGTFLQA